MKKMIIGLGIILMFSLVSCKGDPIGTQQNGDFKLELLFEKDGVKMYRFRDGGINVYWSEKIGKTQYEEKL